MRFSIVHISDIHVKSDSKELQLKFQKLGEIIKTIESAHENYLFLFTGDLAYSGKKSEYDLLANEIEKLKSILLNRQKRVHIVVAPGNHDCDLSGDQDLRNMVIEKMHSYAHETPRTAVVNTAIESQRAFFAFANEIGCQLDSTKIVNEFLIDDIDVKINLVNTSWGSTVPEKQNLIVPLPELERINRHPSHLNLTIHHHPSAWIDRSISAAFKRYVREFSDLIFTGHEHDPLNYSLQHSEGDQQYYFEAGEFHNHKPGIPGRQFFKILDIDRENKKMQITEYCWIEKNGYFKSSDPFVSDLYQGSKTNRFGETLAPNFIKYLKDPGMLIKHSRKKNLELRDFYIFPKLEMNTQDEQGKNHFKIINGESTFLDFFTQHPRISISGEDKSGKSSLARIIFETLFSHDYLPIMLDGSSLTNANKPYVANLIAKKCSEQYRTMDGEMFLQQESNAKVLIIDDFDKINLGDKKLGTFLSIIDEIFDRIIILSDFNVSYNPVKEDEVDSIISYFAPFEISVLTSMQREALIEKWLQLGGDFSAQISQISPQQINKYIRTTISEYGVPNYPLFVVTYLQHIESERDFKADASLTSNEKLLSSLIDLTLSADTGYNIVQSTKKNYLTELAFQLHSTPEDYLTESEFLLFHESYVKIRDEDLKHTEIWNALISTKILVAKDGKFGFKYSYLQSYFLANYLRLNITKPNFQTIMNNVLSNIHLAQNSNTVSTFSLYTSDTWLIDRLIQMVDNVLPTIEPGSIASLSATLKEKTKLSEIKLVTVQHTDDAKEESIAHQKSELDEQYDSIPYAVRLIKVLGLVLKNSIDHLPGDKRQAVVLAVFNLSARMIALQIKGLQSKEMEKHIQDLGQRIKEKSPVIAEVDAKQEVAGKVVRMVFNFTGGLIDIVSRSVGAESLKNTYQKIDTLDANERLFEFYQLAIKTEWFRNYPIEDAKKLYDEYERDLLPRPLIRFLTYRSLSYINGNEDYARTQAICTYFGIDINTIQVKKLLKSPN